MRTGTIKLDSTVGEPIDCSGGADWQCLSNLHPPWKRDHPDSGKTKLFYLHYRLLNLLIPLRWPPCRLMFLVLAKFALLVRMWAHKSCSRSWVNRMLANLPNQYHLITTVTLTVLSQIRKVYSQDWVWR